MGDLEGRVALVTGGLGVIGRTIGRVLADNGARVALSDLPLPPSATPEISAHSHDVTSEEDWRRVRLAVESELGEIDILCNAAGIRPESAPLTEVSLADWHRTIAVNTTGVLLGCQAVVPGMRVRRYGKVINIASTVAKEAAAGAAVYSASKQAVIALTQSLAKECGPDNLNVNAVCPGPIESPVLHPTREGEEYEELVARLSALSPLGRLIEAVDVAELVAFLAGERARNINGQSITIDGGRSTHV